MSTTYPSATILVVDDDPMQLELLEAILKRAGHHVLRAGSGEEALEVLAARPDTELLLLDVMLPGRLDGLAVCQHIRADPHRTYLPIIMVTALGQVEQVALGLEAGADDYITKPFSMREILARVQAALRIRHMQRDLSETQHRYQVLVETSRDLIFTLDNAGHLTYVSPMCETLTGYTAETLLADEQPFVRFIHPADQARLASWLASRLRRATDDTDLEVRIVRADGQLRWANLAWSTLYDRAGRPIGLQGAIRDVTHRREIEAATWRRSQELAALNLIASRITQSLELRPTLDEALDALLEVVGVEYGAIYVLDNMHAQLQAVRGLPDADARQAFAAAAGPLIDPARELLVRRERLDQPPDQITIGLRNFGVQALLTLPLRERGAAIGVMLLASRDADKFDPNEVTLISTVAEQISAALTNARLYEDARHRAEQLVLLNEVSRMMTSTLDLEKVLRVIMEATVSMLQGEAGSVLLLDEETGELSFAAAVGSGADQLRGVRLPAGAGIAGQAVREGRSLLIADVQEDKRFYRGVDQQTGLTTRGLVATPLRARDRIIGVMEVINKRNHPFTPADVELLDMLAPTAASAIENARLYARETQLAEEVRRRNRELSVLHALSAALSESLEIRQVMDAALAVLQPELEFDHGRLALKDGSIVAEFQNNRTEAVGQPADRSGPAQQLLREAMAAHAVRVWPQTGIDPAALAVVPLWGHDHIQGELQLAWRQPRPYLNSLVSLLEAIGQQIGVAIERAHLYEVAQRRAVEIERSHRQLVQSEKLAATGRLAMSLAHEINNPLQAIQNCLHLVLEFELEEDRRRYYLDMAREEVERLSVLVQSMLDFYRPARSEQPTADVQTVIERVLALADQKLRNNQIELALDFPPDRAVAQIAPDQLGQVCLNLIMNSIEAMEDGGRLSIAAHANGEWIEAVFADNGPGIPAADLPHIFEPFYTTKSEGTGLGLAISFTIIERHGGTLQVASQPGAGATFTLRLPKALN